MYASVMIWFKWAVDIEVLAYVLARNWSAYP